MIDTSDKSEKEEVYRGISITTKYFESFRNGKPRGWSFKLETKENPYLYCSWCRGRYFDWNREEAIVEAKRYVDRIVESKKT